MTDRKRNQYNKKKPTKTKDWGLRIVVLLFIAMVAGSLIFSTLHF